MKASLLIAAAAAVLPTQVAGAQEAEPEGSVREPIAESGFHAELLGGYDTDGFEEGLLFGGRIGYDFAVGDRVLLGVDAEINDVTTDRHLTVTAPPLRARDGLDLYVGGRATFALSRRFRIYGGAGYTRQKQGLFIQTDPTPPPFGVIAVQRRNFDGYRLTAGAQFLLGERAFVGAEYRYSNYEYFGNNRGQLVGSLGIRF